MENVVAVHKNRKVFRIGGVYAISIPSSIIETWKSSDDKDIFVNIKVLGDGRLLVERNVEE